MTRIAIIGGGFGALNLAWRLANLDSKEQLSIDIFEKEAQLGGMAGGFQEKNWAWTFEKHYHHLFAKDRAFQNFLKSLDLSDKLFYRKTLTSTLWQQQIYQLDTAWSLLNFTELSFIDRLRTGLVLAFLKVIPNGQFLEKYRASDFLQKTMGQKSWQIIWQPLFQAKFADWADDINLAWFWARINPRTAKLGYVEGGFQSLANLVQQKLAKRGVKINLQCTVKKISPVKSTDQQNSRFKLKFISTKDTANKQPSSTSQTQEFDLIINTLPSPQFSQLIDLPELKSAHLQGLAAMTMILRLKDQLLLDNTYWLNVNERDWPFLAVVEHDHFVDQRFYNHEHLVYIGKYLSTSDPVYQFSAKKLWQSYLPFLRQLNPKIEEILIDYRVTKEAFAQPLVKTNHSRNLPSLRTSYPNLYWVSMQHIYPFDRGLNQAIVSSNRLFELIKKDLKI
ncbi:MAG TPA: NAD(P)-binding protein [Candidatus Woesebacteria bacterium]|nr:NAD(P)-binding protein [Candidatus Woesebacteria bacterium]HPA61674.1 NAD(P)-binding protein [Candidatus Woesebacteria bacterium]HQO51268.1 NAD(P)-binding protein [Candidatus Woesebacteria bacterium]HUM56965.1 NAD(P)-binding protein [Candidatus Woesebacteria bacterium]